MVSEQLISTAWHQGRVESLDFPTTGHKKNSLIVAVKETNSHGFSCVLSENLKNTSYKK